MTKLSEEEILNQLQSEFGVSIKDGIDMLREYADNPILTIFALTEKFYGHLISNTNLPIELRIKRDDSSPEKFVAFIKNTANGKISNPLTSTESAKVVVLLASLFPKEKGIQVKVL